MLLHHRYQILRDLAEGSFGKTFLAEDTQMPTRQQCVIKQLKPINDDRPEVVRLIQERFAREAAVLEAVGQGHSQIPNLLAYFETDGQFYLVQEWVEGTPLSDLVQTPWPEEKVSALLVSALDALAHVHAQSIIHRDIKPDNIIIRQSDQLPCLIDFGTVKELMNTVVVPSASQANSIVIGTLGFMAPEQAVGRPVFSSDLYSLGMTAIYLLTARSPLEIPTDSLNGRLLWNQFAPDINPRLAGILTRAIHPNASIRFANAADMLAVLQQPSPATSSPVLEETTVSTPAARPIAPPFVSPPAATVVNSKTNPTAIAVQPSPINSPDNTLENIQSNKLYNPNVSAGSWFQQPFFKWWVGGIVGALGLAALILFGSNSFSRKAPTIDASSPEILEATINTLEEKVENNPNNEKASLELVEAYLYGGDVDAAEGVIAELLDEDDTNASALYQQGRLQFFQSDYAGAIASLEKAVAQNNRNGQVAVMLGRAYQETGDYDNAKAQFDTARSLSGAQGEAHLNLSYLNHLQGETQIALDELAVAAKFLKGNDRIKIHTQRSALYFDLRERDRAEAEWESAIALSPQNPEDYVLQSISKFFLGDSEGAIATLKQAIAINPKFTEAYAMESLIHLNQGDIEAAITAIDEAVAIDEFSTSALKIIADVAVSSPEPNPEFALTAMDQALAINPNNPYILNQRCSFMLTVKEVDTAIENCTRSIEVNPFNVEAYNTRGQTHLSQLDFERAEADFTRIIDINEAVGRAPDAAAYAQRAAARTGLENPEGAKADLDRALEINSEQ